MSVNVERHQETLQLATLSCRCNVIVLHGLIESEMSEDAPSWFFLKFQIDA